jgi:hypothetical protein
VLGAQGGQCGPCRQAGVACTTTADCCGDGVTLVCSRSPSVCVVASNLALGEPCKANGQCASGLCIGFCSDVCQTSQDCGDGTVCVRHPASSAGANCFPTCGAGTSVASCLIYGSGACTTATNVEGDSVQVCLD